MLVISEDAAWHSVRLGLSADVRLSPRLKFSGEAAFVPYTQLNSYDTHWLRLGTGLFDISGRIPEHGTGYGVQLEAVLSYDVSERFSIGAGGRYWYMKTTGETDFENVIVGVTLPAAQPIDFETERYGVFLQGSYRFGT